MYLYFVILYKDQNVNIKQEYYLKIKYLTNNGRKAFNKKGAFEKVIVWAVVDEVKKDLMLCQRLRKE